MLAALSGGVMTVTFSPDIEERIAQKAQARGIAPDEYVREVVARDFAAVPEPLSLNVDEFLAELNRIGKDLPKLPDYAYTREAMYEDHD
jgi:hypothetical protein